MANISSIDGHPRSIKFVWIIAAIIAAIIAGVIIGLFSPIAKADVAGAHGGHSLVDSTGSVTPFTELQVLAQSVETKEDHFNFCVDFSRVAAAGDMQDYQHFAKSDAVEFHKGVFTVDGVQFDRSSAGFQDVGGEQVGASHPVSLENVGCAEVRFEESPMFVVSLDHSPVSRVGAHDVFVSYGQHAVGFGGVFVVDTAVFPRSVVSRGYDRFDMHADDHSVSHVGFSVPCHRV